MADESKVLFAYLYGPFLEDRSFHDIDVGVYLAISEKAGANLLALESALKTLLQEKTPLVDVRVLDWAPQSFAYPWSLLFSRDEDLRVRCCVWAMSRYLDLKPLRDQALMEAIRSWSSTEK